MEETNSTLITNQPTSNESDLIDSHTQTITSSEKKLRLSKFIAKYEEQYEEHVYNGYQYIIDNSVECYGLVRENLTNMFNYLNEKYNPKQNKTK